MSVDPTNKKNAPPEMRGNQWERQLRDAQDLAAKQAAELAVERAKNVELLAKVNEGLAAAGKAEAELALARAEAKRVEALFWAKRTETLQAAAELAADEVATATALAILAEAQYEHSEMLQRLEAAHRDTLTVIEKLERIVSK